MFFCPGQCLCLCVYVCVCTAVSACLVLEVRGFPNGRVAFAQEPSFCTFCRSFLPHSPDNLVQGSFAQESRL